MSRAKAIIGKASSLIERKMQGEDLYKALKEIVDDRSMGKVNGMQVDLTTANLAVQVLDKVNKVNRDKLLSLDIRKLIDTVYKVAR